MEDSIAGGRGGGGDTGGGAQAAMHSFALWRPAHLMLCGLVPSRLGPSIRPWPGVGDPAEKEDLHLKNIYL